MICRERRKSSDERSQRPIFGHAATGPLNSTSRGKVLDLCALPQLARLGVKAVGFVVLLFAAVSIGSAQNSDLGLLGEVSYRGPRYGLQVNYARQLLERPAGRLYLEVPLIIPVTPYRQGLARIFITPGLRYHRNLTDRVALYGSGGVGFVSTPFNPRISWAVTFGGGLDYRLTRLWSVRGDIRHLIGSRKVDGSLYLGASRNDTILSMGIGLHF